MSTISAAGSSERPTEDMIFDSVSTSPPSSTHLVYLGYMPVAATARVETI